MAEKTTKTAKSDMLSYKGRPLVRCGSAIYYGDMAETVVVRMDISGTVDFGDLKLPNKVRVYLLSTDEDLNPIERIKNNTMKNSLADAIETAAIWLDMELGK
jgi:hypothetical protein